MTCAGSYTRRMERLRVEPGELHAAASGWRGLASDLTPPPPTVVGSPFQATAWAVNEINAGTAFTMSAFEARIHATAIKTSAAASLYTNQEETSSDLLRSVGEAM
jgi:hypothetical protein